MRPCLKNKQTKTTTARTTTQIKGKKLDALGGDYLVRVEVLMDGIRALRKGLEWVHSLRLLRVGTQCSSPLRDEATLCHLGRRDWALVRHSMG